MRHDQSQMHHLHSIRSRTIAVLLASLLFIILMLPKLSPAQAENVSITRYDNRFEIFHPIQASGGMVASDHRLASEVGADIMRQGGNAIDAAVAVGFVLAVVLPYAGNLGGGGFMLVREAKTGSMHAIDFRETAPAAARKEMFLNQEGEVIRGKSTISPYAVAVPGTVAGLLSAAQQFGVLPLKTLLSPAIHLAENGFTVSPVLAQLFSRQRSHLERWPSTREVFFKRKTDAPDCLLSECPSSSLVTFEAGETLFQPDLARTLRLIAEKGIDGFYSGPVAQSIVDTLAASTRPMTLEDLSRYRIVMRKPAQGTYRGYEVYSMPAPSSGGVHLIQMLNILERFPLSEFGAGSAKTIHLIAESARLAYADRAEYLGDPDFVNVPQRGLTAKSYADALLKRIDLLKATPSKQVKAGPAGDYESEQTTHFSAMDASGNVVSCTYTLNLNFGSGIVARGTGMLLNNEMDDFSAKPGAANAFGLLGGFANAIEPGKRPLSSMTPVIVLKEEQPWLATGTPGGARIITTVLQTIINTIDFKMNIAEALSMPRVHHQWMPDFLRIEKGLSPDTIRLLKEKGHVVRVMPTMGRVQTVQQQNGVLFGATDPRNPDGAAIGIERMQ